MLKVKTTRTGAIAVLTALLLLPLLALVALAIDLGYIAVVSTELQATADSAALASVSQLLNQNYLRTRTNTTAVTQARAAALTFAELNVAGGVRISIDPNTSNSASGDLLVGYLPNPTDFQSAITTTINANVPYNAVKVVARRSSTLNGTVPLFFSKLFNFSSASIEASATAALEDRITGFKITQDNPAVTTSLLIPIAIDVNLYRAVIGGTSGTDTFTYNDVTSVVTTGSDSINEGVMLGKTQTAPGNFGTVVLGSPSNSITDLNRQILYGLNVTDLSYYGGTLTLSSSGTLPINGSSGFPVSLNDSLRQVIGQRRIAPLYDNVTANGATTLYNIVGFGGIVIVDSNLLRKPRTVSFQPAFVVDPTAQSDASTSTSSTYVFKPPRLVR